MSRRYRPGSPPSGGGGGGFKFSFKNPLTKVRISQAMSKMGNVLSTVTELAHVVNDMGPNPGLRNYAALGVVALSKLVESTGFDPDEDPRFVNPTMVWSLSNSLQRIYAQRPNTSLLGSGDKRYQVTALDGGHMVVFQCSSGSNEAQGVWFVGDVQEHEMLSLIGREVWKELGTRIELAMPETMLGEGGVQGDLQKWRPNEILESTQATEIHDYIKSFLDKGKTRSILLYGQPGTGKSHMLRAIVNRVALPTLFLEQRQFASMGSFAITRLLELLRPEVLVIDDLDRVPFLESFLGTIDSIRDQVKLLLVTMNDKDSLDPAVVRAGRFTDEEEVVRVRSVQEILPEINGELLVEIEKWPIAFQEEMRTRIDVRGLESETSQKRLNVMRQRVITNARLKKRPDEKLDQEASTESLPPQEVR